MTTRTRTKKRSGRLPVKLPNPLPLLLTVPQACVVIGIGRTKFYELRDRGLIETCDVAGSVRVHVEEAQACAERVRPKKAAR